MLTFNAINVIHRINYLSDSQIGQSYQSQYSLYNVDTMKHTIGGKMAQDAVLPQGRGKMVQFHIF